MCAEAKADNHQNVRSPQGIAIEHSRRSLRGGRRHRCESRLALVAEENSSAQLVVAR
jgi:hypothetical protein